MEPARENSDGTPISADYYFGYGVGPNNRPALEAVKTWEDNGIRQFDTFTIAEYDTYEAADRDEEILTTALNRDGLQAALQQAEAWATRNGYLAAQRPDGRLFERADAPLAPFLNQRPLSLNALDLDTEEYPAFSLQEALEQRWIRPLTLHSAVTYSFEVQPSSDAEAVELVAAKYWLNGDELAQQTQVIRQYDDLASSAPTVDMLELYEVSDQRGHQAALWRAELWAMETGVLDPDRDDPRLFTDGPPDSFMTLAERTAGTPNPYWHVESAEAQAADRQFRQIEQFKHEFEGIESDVLTPIHPTINYGFLVEQTNPTTCELVVEKFWHDEHGELQGDARPLMRRDVFDSHALKTTKDDLLDTYADKGLDALMADMQELAIREGTLLAGSPLFTEGPPDRFTLPDAHVALKNIYPREDPFEHDSDSPTRTAVPAGRWSFVTHNALAPDGEALGVSLSLVSYPYDFVDGRDPADKSPSERSPQEEDLLSQRRDAGDYEKRSDLDNPRFHAQAIEVAQFTRPEDADRFRREYVGYLDPDYVTAQELAEEVAKSEGLAGEFKALRGRDLQTMLDEHAPVEITPQDWHPFSRYAQRDHEWEMGHEPLPREGAQPVPQEWGELPF